MREFEEDQLPKKSLLSLQIDLNRLLSRHGRGKAAA